MKLILTDNDGVLLDKIDVDREEWDRAQHSMPTAASILRTLEAGKDAQ